MFITNTLPKLENKNWNASSLTTYLNYNIFFEGIGDNHGRN
nr:MAG TPA: hypothetical protein [Caudoviricetes sp.]